MKHEFFHWPDHVIGKRESRQIREAHNAALNDYHELLESLKDMTSIVGCLECIHNKKSLCCKQYTAAVALIKKAEGQQ